MPDLLDLPQPVIEQIAKVRIDKPFYWYMEDAPKKRYAFWVLRRLCWATRLAAWPARHAVVKAELGNVARLGDAEWCRVLLDAGASVNDIYGGAGGLYKAAMSGHTAVVVTLVEAGANVHARNDIALRFAAMYGYTATVEALLDAGADVHAGKDDIALREAARNGHTATVELLLARGADASVLE